MEFEGIRIDHSRKETTKVENYGYMSLLLIYFRSAVLHHDFQTVEGKHNKELVKEKDVVLSLVLPP